MQFKLTPGSLTYADLFTLLDESTTLELDSNCIEKIYQSEKTVTDIVNQDTVVYGINTGFGLLANTKIDRQNLELLQKCLVLSHAAGIGELLPDLIVRLILLLKINSLARGYSGVKLSTIQALLRLFNEKIYPCIPCKGSVGASGDLAPLAHMSAVLIGVGEARCQGQQISAQQALNYLGLDPLILAPKEGLALLNGTQVSTAIALYAAMKTEVVFQNTLITGALTVDAAMGSLTPFDERIHSVRGHAAQSFVAQSFRQLLKDSEILNSHKRCSKVQDPYSLRCQPQVMGACLTHFLFAKHVLMTEANAVSDNPLIFSDQNEILSGGNFHAEPVAMAADTLALCIAEIGALSERRIALLVDPNFSGLPAFLVKNPGVNSGFMIAHVTATALASENKSLAHPASVDSLPSSANQEDHVSMATFAARRTLTMLENTAGIVGIELLAACQGIDFRRPLKSSPLLESVYDLVRSEISFYEMDRFFAPDIAQAKSMVFSKQLIQYESVTCTTNNGIIYGSTQTSSPWQVTL